MKALQALYGTEYGWSQRFGTLLFFVSSFSLSLRTLRYSLLVISSFSLHPDTSIFDIRYFIFLSPSGHFDIRYSLFDIRYSIIHFPLPLRTLRYSIFDIRYSIFNHSFSSLHPDTSIFDIRYSIIHFPLSLRTLRYSIFDIRYSLFVIQSFYFCQHLRIIIEKIIQCGSSHLKNPGSFGFVATSLG